jgi:hypothetical protein
MSNVKYGIKRALDKLKIAGRRGLTAAELARDEARGLEIAVELVRAGLVVSTRHNHFVLRKYAGSDFRSFFLVDDDRRSCVNQRDIIGRVAHAREIHGPPASRARRPSIAVPNTVIEKYPEGTRKPPHRKPWEEARMSRRSWYRHVYPLLRSQGGAQT